MKTLILSFLLAMVAVTSNAQINSDTDENRHMTFTFWQWTSYGSPGYLFKVYNHTDVILEVNITSEETNIDTVVYLAPYSYDVLQLGNVSPLPDYIEGAQFKAQAKQPGHNFTLTVETSGSPYAYKKPRQNKELHRQKHYYGK